MVASSVGCAIVSGCKGQGSFPSTSGDLESRGTSKAEWRRRISCTTEFIGIRPYGSSSSKRWLSLPQKTSRFQLSQTFVLPLKAVVLSQASDPRVIASKQVASKGKHDRELKKSSAQVQIKGKSEKQAKSRTNSPASSSDGTSTTRQVVVKDGFAGLAALKTQLENERPRISRVNLNDVGGELLKQQKQAELRRRQEVVKSSTSPETEVTRGTIPSEVNSSDGPIREGGKTLIRVTNLAKQVTEEEYKFIMQSIPEVTSWKYLSDRGGQCLGYGFCEAQAESDIEAILQYLSQQVLHGKKMKASLSESSGDEYKQSLERQTRPAVTSKGARMGASSSAPSSSSVRDRVSKGNPSLTKQAGLRDVWKLQPSSSESATTEMKSSKYSSQEFRAPQDENVDEILRNSSTNIEAGQNFAPSVMERDAGEMVINTSVDSSQGFDNKTATKLSGQSVLEALQRAAALRDGRSKPRKRKGSGGGKYSSDSDSEDDTKQGPLPPLVFKLEWGAKIEELENDVKQLRMLS